MFMKAGLLLFVALFVASFSVRAEVLELQAVISSNDSTEDWFNDHYLRNVSASKDVVTGNVYVSFDYLYGNGIPQAHLVGELNSFKISFYDMNGNYLNHFTTGSDIGQAVTTVGDVFRFELCYSFNIRDLRDAEYVGLSFDNPWYYCQSTN